MRLKRLAPLGAVICVGLFVLGSGVQFGSTASATRVRLRPSTGLMLPVPASSGAGRHTIRGAKQTGSYNWSGYVQTTSKRATFTSVKDFWTVPTVNTSKSGDQYSSDWVGIGGATSGDSTLVQDGTEADNIGGTARYDSWTEILPAAEDVIPGLTIKAGDKIEAITQEISAGTFKMTVMDLTTGKQGGRTVAYKSSGLAVEAIHERPCVKDGCTSISDLATLTTTTNVTLDPGSYSSSAPGPSPTWKPLLKAASGATLDQIFMFNNAATAHIASPSLPDGDTDGYTVADGSKSPPPPKS